MRRAPAALILAACFFLAAPTFAAEAQPVPSVSPDAAASVSSDIAKAPAGLPDDDTPPPFMRPHVAKPVPARPDLTFAVKPGPKGFHGLDWGAPLAEAKTRLAIVPVTEPVALKDTFMRKDELLKLGMADLRTVAYYFPKGRFSGVGITFEGEANFFLIKDHLIELYGPGRQIGDRYGWTWKDCNIELRLKSGAGELRYTFEQH